MRKSFLDFGCFALDLSSLLLGSLSRLDLFRHLRLFIVQMPRASWGWNCSCRTELKDWNAMTFRGCLSLACDHLDGQYVPGYGPAISASSWTGPFVCWLAVSVL